LFASWLAGRSAGEIEFAPGVATPKSFGDPRREHLATRRAGGLFDFSFMQCAEIGGPRALECVDALQTRRLAGLRPGRIAYTLLLREDGSVLNDATVWRLAPDRFWVFTGRRADYATVARFAAEFGIGVTTPSLRAVIAIQGDISRPTIERALPGVDLAALGWYGFFEARFAATECLIARLGYSGETGYEIAIADQAAPALWEALLAAGADAGLAECGFDATDSLRIEAGHVLFTRELAAPVTPFELGFGRLVDFDGRDFVGAPALRRTRWDAPARRLVGLLPASRNETEVAAEAIVPPKLEDGTAAMTSACQSPLFERRIGIGFAAATDASPGSRVELRGGGSARVTRLPFYDPPRVLARRGYQGARAARSLGVRQT
jgi:aminomethyltransferase